MMRVSCPLLICSRLLFKFLSCEPHNLKVKSESAMLIAEAAWYNSYIAPYLWIIFVTPF